MHICYPCHCSRETYSLLLSVMLLFYCVVARCFCTHCCCCWTLGEPKLTLKLVPHCTCMLARYCCWVTVAFITVLTIHGKLLIELFWQHHYLVLLEWESVRSFWRGSVCMWLRHRGTCKIALVYAEPAVGWITNLQFTSRSMYIINLHYSCSSKLPFLQSAVI